MKMESRRLQLVIKRILDVVFAVIVVILASPLLIFLALVIYFSMGKPILYRHRRPGHHEKIFSLYKFRTMTDDRDDEGNLLPNEERLTKAGKIIRRLSLDELPQLWNILRGDLSLVGPRPLLIAYLDIYTPEQRRRHNVKPGITGWAQVNGRNEISYNERFAMDVWYVDNWSLWLDIKILLKTVPKVFKREGLGWDGQTTARLFDPSQHKHPDDVYKSVESNHEENKGNYA